VPIPEVAACPEGRLRETLLHRLADKNRADLFGNDVMKCVLRFKWDAYAFRKYRFEFIQYLILLLCFSLYCFNLNPNTELTIEEAVPAGVGSLFVLRFARLEIIEMYAQRFDIGKYFGVFWNMLDWAVYVLASSLLPLQIAGCGSACTFAATCTMVAAWCKLLYFLRALESTGPLIKMILRICSDMRWFLLILLIVMIAFAIPFYIQLHEQLEDYTANYVFQTMFAMMLGGFELKNDDEEYFFNEAIHPSLTWALFVLYMSAVMIVMLNLLIALMSDSYAAVKAQTEQEFLLERARIIVELERTTMGIAELQDDHKFPHWLHILRPKGPRSHFRLRSGITALHRLNKKETQLGIADEAIAKIVKDVNKSVEARLEQFETSLKHSIRTLQGETNEILMSLKNSVGQQQRGAS
jgi:hypothetical protein